jgi:hypothetical protein
MAGKLKWAITFISLAALWILLVACGNSQLEDLSPEEIISRSADRMIGLAGFEFLIERSGEPVFIDYEETISFRRAEGKFMAPDQLFANVRIIAPGLVTEVRVIQIEEEQWETNLLTGKWQPTDPRYKLDLSLFFDADTGIQAILSYDMVNPLLVGFEELPEIPGKQLYAVEATLDGGRVYQMSYGMIDNETLQVKIWVDPDSFDLHRVLIIDPANPGDEEDTNWQIDFWSFGSTFEIEKPILGNE